jgi:hypothetical protein
VATRRPHVVWQIRTNVLHILHSYKRNDACKISYLLNIFNTLRSALSNAVGLLKRFLNLSPNQVLIGSGIPTLMPLGPKGFHLSLSAHGLPSLAEVGKEGHLVRRPCLERQQQAKRSLFPPIAVPT